MNKPFTQVKLWNGLIGATNKIKKTESDEVIQKEEKY
jgi:hypothetical protein